MNIKKRARPSALEKALLGVRFDQAHTLLPGLLVAALLAWASIRLCTWVGCDLLGFAKIFCPPSV